MKAMTTTLPTLPTFRNNYQHAYMQDPCSFENKIRICCSNIIVFLTNDGCVSPKDFAHEYTATVNDNFVARAGCEPLHKYSTDIFVIRFRTEGSRN